ncbi:MAG: TetR/AcrR family transcriptional regulator [Bacteroidota bacterium]
MTTKESISSCAARLFRKKGYPATSMRDIADRVGIKAASIYNHYRSKQMVLEELLLDIAHRFATGMEVVKSSDQKAVDQLAQLIDLHVELAVNHTDASALITGEWVHLEGKTRSTYLQLRDQYESDFRQILEQAKSDGYFKDVDTEIAMFSILSTLRWLYSWYNRNKQYDVEALKEQMKRALL